MDYGAIGFKCGIEVHQQLEGRKLFCSCPTINSNAEPDIRIARRLRAVAGETGEIDRAAEHEMKKGREFIYLGDSADVCLVETDSEPPHDINKEALKTALQVAKMLNMEMVGEVQVMRKTVVDGSNTSGFQRTALIGTNGCIETSKGKVRVAILCLEEEACQKIKEEERAVTYRLDRLGIPLLEIGTEADIRDAEHAKEAAGIIGMMLRSTGRVKRGLGTIRQDVNLSIKGHPRIEIKGFQELRSMPKVIEKEAERELEETRKGAKAEAHVRKAEEDFSTSYMRPMPGAARMYPETDIAPIRITKEMLESIEVPKLLVDRALNLKESYGLNEEVAGLLVKRGKDAVFEGMVKEFRNLRPTFIATTLTSTLRDIRRRFNVDAEKLSDDDIRKILGYIDEGTISKDRVVDVIVDYARGGFKIEKYKQVDERQLEEEIREIAEKSKGATFGALMGIVMRKHQGKADGRKVSEILRRYVK